MYERKTAAAAAANKQGGAGGLAGLGDHAPQPDAPGGAAMAGTGLGRLERELKQTVFEVVYLALKESSIS